MDTQTQRMDLWTQQKKERVGKTEKVVCVKQTVSGNLLYNSQVALCDYLKGWDRMGEGGQEGEDTY